ncbi:MAG: DMT family transporter [Planctomycetota bacterium]
MAPSPRLVHLVLLTVSLLFGANYVFTKQVVAVIPPQAWVGFRIFAATAILVPLALRFGRGGVPRRLLPGLLLASLLGVVLNQVLFTEGIRRTTPAHSAVINSCIPVWTLLLAVLFRQEKLTAAKILAVVVAFLGVSTLLRVDELLAGGDGLSREQLVGDLLTWANGVSFSAHLILMRRLGPHVDPWLATGTLFAAAALMVPLYSGPELTGANLDAVATPPVLWFALYAVLFATVTTYLLNTWALRHTRSSHVALYINVQPLVAAVLNTCFGEPFPDWRFYVAFAAVTCGLWLQARRG